MKDTVASIIFHFSTIFKFEFPYNSNSHKSVLIIFCKHLNPCAEMSHTSPLQCSECKIVECRKKLAYAKKLVG